MAFGNVTSRRPKHHDPPSAVSSKFLSSSRQPQNSKHRSILTYHHRPPSSPNSNDHRGGCRSILSKALAFLFLLLSLYTLATRYGRQMELSRHTGLRETQTHRPPPIVEPTQPKVDSTPRENLDEVDRLLPPKDLEKENRIESEDGERIPPGPQEKNEAMDGEDEVEKPKRRNSAPDDDTDDLKRVPPPDRLGPPDALLHEGEISGDGGSPDIVPHEALPEDGHMAEVPPTIEPKGFAFTTAEDFERHRSKSEAALKQDDSLLRNVITAYIEPPLHDIVPNTGSRGDLKDIKDKGIPPEFVVPLPRRTHSPKELRKIEYPSAQTCHDMPGKFPIDRGLEINEQGEVVVWNVGNTPTPPDFPELEAPFCPVELDPFLPWIHDVFPSQDGSRIEFIAQNKRRCRTGAEYTENVNRLVPQVALLQSISVEKISDAKARELAPDVWHPTENPEVEDSTPRYRLAPYEAASPNGKYTRFICRFHMTTALDGAASVSVPLGETLSEFPFNYEYINYRKEQNSLLTPKGKDTLMFWTSNLRFSCPLPENMALRQAVANGRTVLENGTPTVFVDVIPIRTSARYNETYLTKEMIGPRSEWPEMSRFDPVERWGPDHVLPRVEASGRWANIPICLPPELVQQHTTHTDTELEAFDTTAVTRKLVPNIAEMPEKPHFLVGCLWASAEFKTRGRESGASTDTIDRLKEWIEFHLLVGFDHIYVYDNSGAHTNETSLESTVALYPGKVTRIDWPSIVCNNNIPAHDSTGERSSQYAAENSCRT
jgi:Glycosyltransferase family 92